ncbi:PDZ domain-containing protein [Akkermansiaceae bacterium]|nr:PDZ domain-containing protein [Akkermansiaceae bacterium]
MSLKCPDAKDSTGAGLAEGVGLKVGKVISGGPLAKSGGREGDFWWKFDGQILVSRGQLVVLLRTKKPNDLVDLEFYRDGKLQKSSLKLGEWPESQTFSTSSNGPPKTPVSCVRRLESSVQRAELTMNGELLSLEKTPEGWRFSVEKEGKMFFKKELTPSNISSSLESRWMEPFMMLQLTLAQKSESKPGEKKERIRYISRNKAPKETN